MTTYTQYHKDNFLKLRDYMRDVVIPQNLEFDMSYYIDAGSIEELKDHITHNAVNKLPMCLAGHSVNALNSIELLDQFIDPTLKSSILPEKTSMLSEQHQLVDELRQFFLVYLSLMFNLNIYYKDNRDHDFLFSTDWESDSTEALGRLNYFIQNDYNVPKGFTYDDSFLEHS